MNSDNYRIFDNITVNKQFIPYMNILKEDYKYKEIEFNKHNIYNINMNCYDLLPGITLISIKTKIDVYIDKTEIFTYDNPDDILIINYISHGQHQLKVDDYKYILLNKDNLNIYIKSLNEGEYTFYGETCFYELIVDKKVISENFNRYSEEFIPLQEYYFDLVKNERNIIINMNDELRNLINKGEEYKAHKNNTKEILFQLKIFELLLYIYDQPFENQIDKKTVYSDAQIRVVRKIKNHLSRDIASYVSLEVLSVSYGINLTTLKKCFKDMYGKPLYTWYTDYKFQRAKELIKNTNYPIQKIANMIGYKSSSKFAKAFKKKIGVLPSNYRKNNKKNN
ncbi:MAG: helix-turn-helix domain-containing protein [Methanosphaera stadtmanae]|nr:helix-turn-helix domain-containing protein [Methanosphaera stadtmanae]